MAPQVWPAEPGIPNRPGGIDDLTFPRRAGPKSADFEQFVFVCITVSWEDDLLDIQLLDEDDPFEITRQAPHLFEHDALGIDDIHDVWRSNPLFYPTKPPAHWLMVSQVSGTVLVVPLAPPDSGNPTRCRPIGCYVASAHLAARYLEDR
jgi:hypothetical protein